jgi:hypothetical protein
VLPLGDQGLDDGAAHPASASSHSNYGHVGCFGRGKMICEGWNLKCWSCLVWLSSIDLRSRVGWLSDEPASYYKSAAPTRRKHFEAEANCFRSP